MPSRFERATVWIAAFVCLFFALGLRDFLPRYPPPPPIPAPPVPAEVKERDASIHVVVRDERGAPIAGASVRVFAMYKGKAHFAGDRETGADGAALLTDLPRGEVWVLAYAPGKARASTALTLDREQRAISLTLLPAKALDVIVVDEADKPFPGASIEVMTLGDPLPYTAVTNEKGEARADRLGAPPYRVRVWARGYDDVFRSGVTPGPSPLRIKLERLATMVVTVVDEKGAAAPGATVLVAGTGLWPAQSTKTEDDGTATIHGLTGGSYDLVARRGDQASKTEIALPVRRGERKEVTLALGAAKRVRVTVTDGEGDGAPPIAGASVVLAEQGISSFPIQGKTGDKGVVDLGPIAIEPASVSARAKGFVARTVAIAADVTEVTVGLVKGGAIAGDVTDERGFPIAGATLEVIGVGVDGTPIAESSALIDFRDTRFEASLAGPRPLIPAGELGVMPGPIPDFPHVASGDAPAAPTPPATPQKQGDPWITRGDGTFRAEPVTPGRVQVIARHPAYVEAISEVVTLRPGGEATVHIVMRRGGLLEGRVLEEDRTPVRGARVELAAVAGGLERVVYAAEDGTFAFASVPDEVLLSVSRPESPGDVAARALVRVPDRERKTVEIILPKPRDTLRLRVTDDRGYPVGRVEVRAVSLDVDEPLRRTLFTSEGGEVRIPDAVGLAMRITLVRPGKAPLIEVLASAPPELTLVMSEGVEGRGEITGRGGRERLEGADVTVLTEAGVRRAKTDIDGVFVIKDLAPGRARVRVKHEGYADTEVTVNVQGDRDHPANLGSIDMSEAGEIEGTVVDEAEQPVAGARVSMGTVPTYLTLGKLPRGVVTTDREGRFVLSGLPEGEVSIEAFSVDHGRGSADKIPIRAGRTTARVTVVLAGGGSSREPKGAGSVAVTLAERSEGIFVVVVPPNSEAEVAGIEEGDRIVSVNGRDVSSLEGTRGLLTGPLGEDVVVELERPDVGTVLVRVRRERVRR